jgi:hypothetical protein
MPHSASRVGSQRTRPVAAFQRHVPVPAAASAARSPSLSATEPRRSALSGVIVSVFHSVASLSPHSTLPKRARPPSCGPAHAPSFLASPASDVVARTTSGHGNAEDMTVEIFRGAGHFVPEEMPDELASLAPTTFRAWRSEDYLCRPLGRRPACSFIPATSSWSSDMGPSRTTTKRPGLTWVSDLGSTAPVRPMPPSSATRDDMVKVLFTP